MTFFPRSPWLERSARTSFEAVERIGVAGLYLCALGTWLSTALQNLGLALVILTFAINRRAWRWAFSSPVFWLCGIAAAYVLTRGHYAAIEFPTTAELQLKASQDWVKLTLFIPIAWYLQRSPKHIPWVLVLCGLGLMARTLANLDVGTVKAILNGMRYGGHLGKPIAYAFYMSVCLLGVTILAPRWLQLDSNRAVYWAKNIGTGILIAALFWLFLAAQSRGPLLALASVLPIALAVRYWPSRQTTRVKNNHIWHVVIGIGLAVLLLGISGAHMLAKRIVDELPSAETALDDSLGKAPRDNTTLRLQMWSFGIEKWTERPWFGWGPGSTQHVLATKDNPALRHDSGEPWDHLHSLYVQLLFSFGLVGAGLAGSIAVLLCLGIVQRYRKGRLCQDETIFLLGNFGLIAIYSLTDFRHLNQDWSSYWLMLAAITLASGTVNNQARADERNAAILSAK